jgi:alpha-D-ribose 1-methylphosphonate 5-triphosphate synthase subunit PhnG
VGSRAEIDEREKYVTRIRLILLAALAMAAVSVAAGAGASSAFAGNGPLWLVNGTRFDCQKETGQYKTLLECLSGGAGSTGQEWNLKELTGTSGLLKLDQGVLALALNLSGNTNFTLHTSNITIICKHMNSNIVLVGGTPAKDHATIHFLECEVEGHSTCTVNSPGATVGLIQVPTIKSEVIYLGTEAEAKKEEGKMGDLFSPESGTTFVELVIGGTGCPLFTKGEQEVKGTVIGEIEPIGTMGKLGLQVFPATAIKKGYRWLKSGEVEELTSSLKVFGVIEATQIGEAEVMLNSNEEWGVEQK